MPGRVSCGVAGLTTARPMPPCMPPATPQGGFTTLSMRTDSTRVIGHHFVFAHDARAAAEIVPARRCRG